VVIESSPDGGDRERTQTALAKEAMV
jgi:hypothetical protein